MDWTWIFFVLILFEDPGELMLEIRIIGRSDKADIANTEF